MVYFVSIGYAFAIVAMAICDPDPPAAKADLDRNCPKSAVDRVGASVGHLPGAARIRNLVPGELASVQQRGAGIKLPQKFVIWIGVSLLYVAMFSPSLFHLVGGTAATPAAFVFQAIGLLIMIGGLALEATADRQKSRFKTQFPGQFCNVGVYRLVRCPNYLGEILFWLGNWVVGLAFYATLAMAIVALHRPGLHRADHDGLDEAIGAGAGRTVRQPARRISLIHAPSRS